MASIQKITGTNTSYKVQYRHNKKRYTKTFNDHETAYIYKKYIEVITTERENFNPEDEHQYTLIEVVLMKYQEDTREFNEIKLYFNNFFERPFNELTYEVLKKHADSLLQKKVRRRGSAKTNTGEMVYPSVTTILRKFAYLSSAINNIRKHNILIENHAQSIVTYLRGLESNAS